MAVLKPFKKTDNDLACSGHSCDVLILNAIWPEIKLCRFHFTWLMLKLQCFFRQYPCCSTLLSFFVHMRVRFLDLWRFSYQYINRPGHYRKRLSFFASGKGSVTFSLGALHFSPPVPACPQVRYLKVTARVWAVSRCIIKPKRSRQISRGITCLLLVTLGLCMHRTFLNLSLLLQFDFSHNRNSFSELWFIKPILTVSNCSVSLGGSIVLEKELKWNVGIIRLFPFT